MKETSKLSESLQSRSWIGLLMSGTDSQSQMGYIENVENQRLCLRHRIRVNASTVFDVVRVSTCSGDISAAGAVDRR